MALLLPATGLRYGFDWQLVAAYGSFTLALLAVTLIDLRTQHIPLLITVPGTLAGLVLGWWVLPSGFGLSLVGLIFGGGVLIAATVVEAARSKEVGGGDWKLSAMIGAFLGWPGIIAALVFTGVFGVAGALLLKRWGGAGGPQALGPWLSAGAVAAMLIGQESARQKDRNWADKDRR